MELETRVSLIEAEMRELKRIHEDVHNDLKFALSGVHKMETEVRETRKWLDDIRIDLKVVLAAVHSLEISTASASAARRASSNESKDILSRWVSVVAIICGVASCVIAVLALKRG
jgi:hypothetical protein